MSPEVSEFFQRLNTYSVRSVYDAVNDVRGTPPIAEICRRYKFQIGGPLAQTVYELENCSAELHPYAKHPFRGRIDSLRQQLNNVVVRIAIVGQIKAGKTSVINALSGRSDYLPTHVNPWTAVPTQLYFGVKGQQETGACFEFFNYPEWCRLGGEDTTAILGGIRSADNSRLKKRPDWQRAALRVGDQFQHLLGRVHRYEKISPQGLAQYLCAGPPVHEQSRNAQPGRYADITKVAHIYLPMEPFVWPTILIDTPGLNDPSFIRVKSTEHILEESDIYVVVLSANQPMSLADITLLRHLRGLDKRRLLVFINRFDEIGQPTAVDVIKRHVEDRLRQEFPNATIPVLCGSALWASIAMAGTTRDIDHLVNSKPFLSQIGGNQTVVPQLQNDFATTQSDVLREQIFEASGIPDLADSLSLLMRESFSTSQGMGLAGMLKSSADLTLSNARRELASLQLMHEESAGNPAHALAQVEDRLHETELLRANANKIIEAAHQQIGAVLKKQTKALQTSLEMMVREFAEDQSVQLRRAMADENARSWHCDTTGFMRDLEIEFLHRFSSALERIASSHETCVAAVKSNLEEPHSGASKTKLVAPWKTQADVRPYLRAVAQTIEIDVGGPWWERWWSSSKFPNRKSDELKQKIVEALMPVAMRLAILADRELASFAGQARATMSDVVSATIDSTIVRLNDLKDRLSALPAGNALRPGARLSYDRNIAELTSLIAACEPVAARLARMGARIG